MKKMPKDKVIAGLALGGLLGSLAMAEILWAICFAILFVEAISRDSKGRS